jgi:hypothetical protein
VYLEALVLEDTLDGGVFSAGRQLCLKDYAKGTIADNLALGVLHLSCLSGEAILHLFSNHLWKKTVSARARGRPCVFVALLKKTYRPCAGQRRLRQADFATSSKARGVWAPLWRWSRGGGTATPSGERCKAEAAREGGQATRATKANTHSVDSGRQSRRRRGRVAGWVGRERQRGSRTTRMREGYAAAMRSRRVWAWAGE